MVTYLLLGSSVLRVPDSGGPTAAVPKVEGADGIMMPWEYNPRMPLSATIEHIAGGIAVVKLSGGLTLGTSLKIADSQIQAAIEGGITKMVIDLTDVEYVDSAGLGMLMYAYGMLNEKGGKVRLCGVTARVLSLLQMTKTDTFLPIDSNCDESVAALQA